MPITPSKPLAIVCEPIDPTCADWLRERCEIIEAAQGDAAFDQNLPQAGALVVRTYTQVTPQLLAAAPNLKVVARAGVGLDNIDLAACANRGVQVVHSPGANTDAVVEYVFALLLDQIRPRPSLSEPLSKEQWAAIRKQAIAPRQLQGSTLGILGLGKVGTRVAEVAGVGGFGMRVIYNDLEVVDAPEGATSVPPETLFEQSDFLTVHIDNRVSNTSIVNAPLIDRMQADVVFINASRGFVVDHTALASFLKRNTTAHASLDVHTPEPITAENPLLALPNARLLPHIGAATAAAHRNMSWVVRDVWRVLQGEPPEHPAPSAPPK